MDAHDEGLALAWIHWLSAVQLPPDEEPPASAIQQPQVAGLAGPLFDIDGNIMDGTMMAPSLMHQPPVANDDQPPVANDEGPGTSWANFRTFFSGKIPNPKKISRKKNVFRYMAVGRL